MKTKNFIAILWVAFFNVIPVFAQHPYSKSGDALYYALLGGLCNAILFVIYSLFSWVKEKFSNNDGTLVEDTNVVESAEEHVDSIGNNAES